MREAHDIGLAGYTTLRVGGPARRLLTAETEGEIIAAVERCAEAREPLFVLGGGSNVVISDAGFDGTVLHIASRGIRAADQTFCSRHPVFTSLLVAAGEPWDDFVAFCVDRGYVGLEALSGIPGTVGATVVQNVGAYGADVSGAVARVRTYDRDTRQVRTFAGADCAFAYRTSMFKQTPDRYVVLDVEFELRIGTQSAPIMYAELARALDVEVGSSAPVADVREAVLALRRSKGMVLDAGDHDTWSAGSFFLNPVVAADLVPDGAAAWPQPDGRVKVSAAWLVDHAGIGKGFTMGGAGTSTKHALAIINRGDATAADVFALAAHIQSAVHGRFGIELVPEPVYLGA